MPFRKSSEDIYTLIPATRTYTAHTYIPGYPEGAKIFVVVLDLVFRMS